MTPFGASGLAPGTGAGSGLQLHHRPGARSPRGRRRTGFELNRHLDFLRAAGQPIERLVMGGGAAGQPRHPADARRRHGLPLRCFAGSEASLVGAAILLAACLSRSSLAGSPWPNT